MKMKSRCSFFLAEHLAIVVVEPGVNRVLVEHRVFDFELQLISEEGVAAAGVDHHLRGQAHFLAVSSHVEADDRFLGVEVHASSLSRLRTRLRPACGRAATACRSNLPRSTW